MKKTILLFSLLLLAATAHADGDGDPRQPNGQPQPPQPPDEVTIGQYIGPEPARRICNTRDTTTYVRSVEEGEIFIYTPIKIHFDQCKD